MRPVKALLTALLWNGLAFGAFVQVQKVHNYPSGTNSFTLTLGTNVTSGNLVLVQAVYSGASAPNVSATGNSNTFTCIDGPGTTIHITSMCYVLSANAGATTVTVTCGGGCSDMGGEAEEYSGCTSCTFDNIGTAGNKLSAGTTTTPTSNSFTPSGAGELLIALIGDETTGQTSVTAGSGFTLIQGDATHVDGEEQNLSGSSGSQTASFTLGSTSNTWAIQLMAFISSGGGGATTNRNKGFVF